MYQTPLRAADGIRQTRTRPARVQISNADTGWAVRFKKAFDAEGCAVACLDRPTSDADIVIWTEGLRDGPTTSFHAKLLESVQSNLSVFEAGNARHVLLQTADGAPWQNGLPGLSRTLNREINGAHCTTLQLPAQTGSDETLSRIARVSLQMTTEDTLTIGDDGQAFGSALKPLSVLDRPLQRPIAASDLFLVTGGGQGITAACTIALAKRTGARFVLVGRTKPSAWPEALAPDASEAEIRAMLARADLDAGIRPAPKGIAKRASQLRASRSIQRTLSAIEAAGGQADYLTMDMSSPGMIADCLRQIKAEHGEVTGLIHGAGVLADRRIGEMTASDVQTVFAPKVEGLRTLLDALDDAALRHVALFSSAAARFGNPGQANYAMANEVLNAVGRGMKAEIPGRNIKVFGWGPWDGGMVSDALKTAFARRGIDVIPVEAGAAVFADVMCADLDETEIIVGKV